MVNTRSTSAGYHLRIVCLLLVAALLPGVLKAEIGVTLEPDPPREGDSFRIAYTVAGDVDEEPDFKPLEQAFEILGRNQQTSLSLINGKYTRQSSWIIEVLPKTSGAFDLPVITIAGERTTPRRVEPTGTPVSGPRDEGLFLEAEASPANPYVQQEVLYTVRLWRRYELSNASLSEPRPEGDALVKPLGEDRQYVAERDGKRYEVVERRYLVFPQRSGTLTLAPVTVTAQVLERAASLFEMFGRAIKTRRVSSPSVVLEVRPVPPEFPAGATWLPARKLRLNEVWTPTETEQRAGEPLSRTLSLWADGLTGGQLPTIAMPEIEGLKIYPDEAQQQDTPREGKMTAIRQQKLAFVATRAGEFEIPEVRLPWWNTETDTLAWAILPAHPARFVTDPLAPREAAKTAEPSLASAAVPAPMSNQTPEAISDWRVWPGWAAVSACLSLAWLVTLAALWQLRHGGKPETTGSAAAGDNGEAVAHAAAKAAVLAACAASDPVAARSALLKWAAQQWPATPPLSLGALGHRLDVPCMTALRDLDAALYGRLKDDWNGAALGAAFRAWPPAKPRAANAGTKLAPLFKL